MSQILFTEAERIVRRVRVAFLVLLLLRRRSIKRKEGGKRQVVRSGVNQEMSHETRKSLQRCQQSRKSLPRSKSIRRPSEVKELLGGGRDQTSFADATASEQFRLARPT